MKTKYIQRQEARLFREKQRLNHNTSYASTSYYTFVIACADGNVEIETIKSVNKNTARKQLSSSHEKVKQFCSRRVFEI